MLSTILESKQDLQDSKDLKIKDKGLSCYGTKVSYMIYKLLDEIKVAPNYKEMSPEDFV